MQVAKTIEAVRIAVIQARERGLKVGLVPTMGALHAGHVSLIQAARKETAFIVVTIFVNPTQFGPNEDLDRYPQTLARDQQICEEQNVDLMFTPSSALMYPPGFSTYVEVQGMQHVLCGVSRPTHFRGVTTVVLKLFHITQPDVAYFGQKDAQQARIIQQMIDDLNLPVQMRICPIVRESDGLALSSRNQYLDRNQRGQAVVLFRSLEAARQRIAAGERDSQALVQLIRETVTATPGACLDYAAVVDYSTLQPLDRLHGKVLVAAAVYFGDTRLIDNFLIDLS